MTKKLPCVLTSLGVSNKEHPRDPTMKKLKNGEAESIGTVYRMLLARASPCRTGR